MKNPAPKKMQRFLALPLILALALALVPITPAPQQEDMAAPRAVNMLEQAVLAARMVLDSAHGQADFTTSMRQAVGSLETAAGLKTVLCEKNSSDSKSTLTIDLVFLANAAPASQAPAFAFGRSPDFQRLPSVFPSPSSPPPQALSPA